MEIKALCDKREVAVRESQKYLQRIGRTAAQEFFGDENSGRSWLNCLILILFIPAHHGFCIHQCHVYAMENGKHVASEVPIARTVDEAWQLVETSERTKKHCMMLENCCYDFFELLTLNMARQGMFGDIIHGEGAYIHNLLEANFEKPRDDQQTDGAYTDMWRLKENAIKERKSLSDTWIGSYLPVAKYKPRDKLDHSLISINQRFFQWHHGRRNWFQRMLSMDNGKTKHSGVIPTQPLSGLLLARQLWFSMMCLQRSHIPEFIW